MDCKKIQELIMSDYIDNEISGEVYNEVKKHVGICDTCGAFEQMVRKNAVEPFKHSGIINPPESIWLNIKSTIQQKHPKSLFDTMKERFFDLYRFRKPVFAAVLVTVVIGIFVLVTQVSHNDQQQVNNYLEEQMGFLVEPEAGGTAFINTDEIDFGTSIEELFL